MIALKNSFKSALFVGIVLIVLLAMINATEKDSSSDKRIVKKRGITEWRFKRMDPRLKHALETLEFDLRVMPLHYDGYPKALYYKLKLEPFEIDDGSENTLELN